MTEAIPLRANWPARDRSTLRSRAPQKWRIRTTGCGADPRVGTKARTGTTLFSGTGLVSGDGKLTEYSRELSVSLTNFQGSKMSGGTGCLRSTGDVDWACKFAVTAIANAMTNPDRR